jgi:hypothetical protein
MAKGKSLTEKAAPKPEMVEIEGKWDDTVKHALSRGKPPNEVR